MTTIEDIERLGCENGEHRGPPAFPESYRILQDPWELAQFIHFVRSHFDRPIEYLEIGLGHAGLFRAMCEQVSIENAIAIDDCRVPEFAAARNRNLASLDDRAQAYSLCVSRTSAHVISRALYLRQIDLAFIDGNHSYEGVRGDVLAVLVEMRPGSLIALHDSIYYGDDGGVAWVVREIEAGEIPGLKVVAKFERVYGIVVCEVT